MPTQLAQMAKATRIFFFGSIVAVIFYVILTQTLGLAFAYLSSLRPPPEIPPTTGFGKLPRPNFRSFKIIGSPEFELDTTTGTLPMTAKKIEVYEIIEPKASYLSLDKAKDIAKRLGFIASPQSISSSLYFWEEEEKSLKMNIFTENFIWESDLSEFVIPIGDFPATAEIVKEATNLLSAKGLLKHGYKEGERKLILARLEGGKIIKTESLSDSSLAVINFFRTLKDPEAKVEKDYPPILPPNPAEGAVQLLTYSPKKNVEVLRLKYNNWEINKEKPETYPLKETTVAWQEVLEGSAAVSLLRERTSLSFEYPAEVELEKVFIRNVFLAYFDDENLQKYLQPIYVFEGDARDLEGKIYEVTFYVQAVDAAWVEE